MIRVLNELLLLLLNLLATNYHSVSALEQKKTVAVKYIFRLLGWCKVKIDSLKCIGRFDTIASKVKRMSLF